MRNEIEIELLIADQAKFTDSMTMLEAKHGIYRLGFKDFKNFNGVRFGYKGNVIVSFKLLDPIDIDKLYEKQYFNFKRRSSVDGKVITIIIGCKIKGLRFPAYKQTQIQETEDGVMTVTI